MHSSVTSAEPIAIDAWVHGVRHQTDDLLSAYLLEQTELAKAISPSAHEMTQAITELTLRGGKRLRPIVAAAGYVAATGSLDCRTVSSLGASLELLQTYLLIHDDWMDGDTHRRGGLAVHAGFRAQHGDNHLGDSLGVLSGDFACTLSWELFTRCDFPSSCRPTAFDSFLLLQKQVIAGQQLDLIGAPDVRLMHDLKTGSYTVRGPVTLGALLGGADASLVAVLESWATPAGIAFQLRDDLLGTFGAVDDVGKPSDDLRHGKNTSVIDAFRRLQPSDAARAIVDRTFGNMTASDAEVHAAVNVLIDSGAKSTVDDELRALSKAAFTRIDDSSLGATAREVLAYVTNMLVFRAS